MSAAGRRPRGAAGGQPDPPGRLRQRPEGARGKPHASGAPSPASPARRARPPSPAPEDQSRLFDLGALGSGTEADDSAAGKTGSAHEPSDAPPGSRSRPLSVAELNRSVQQQIERTHPELWIVGEISNLARYSSGHLYFTLKDSASEISAVMFAGANRRLRFQPADGVEVLACGRPTVWLPRGRYQFVVEEMEPRGKGSLLEAFEALKLRLAAEGMFDASRKRPIPMLPSRIGVVTSPDGAALRDILKVLRLRHAGVDVLIAPVKVQGVGAADEIAAALDALASMGGVDVIIVGRGGGSIEDLWTFNEETVARAIASCPIPVISAVGHETDVTIADFAADVRAATPSQAAEMVVASRQDLTDRLAASRARLASAMHRWLAEARRIHERLASHPALTGLPSVIASRGQFLDELGSSLVGLAESRLSRSSAALRELTLRLAPRQLREVLARRRDATAGLARHLTVAMSGLVSRDGARLSTAAGLLQSLSPLQVLQRGYAICLDSARGAVVRSSTEVSPGDAVLVKLARGELECRVLGTRSEMEE